MESSVDDSCLDRDRIIESGRLENKPREKTCWLDGTHTLTVFFFNTIAKFRDNGCHDMDTQLEIRP